MNLTEISLYQRREQYLDRMNSDTRSAEETEAQRRAADAERVRMEQQRLLNDAVAQANADRALQGQHPPLDAALADLRVEAIAARLKLPDLWRNEPAAWFLRSEALFATHRITSDQTRFSHVISALDANTFIELQDAIQSAPDHGKYEFIKKTIISRLADSADRSLQRLLNEMALGVDRPTQLLAKMRNLAQGRLSDDVLRVRWAALLPSNVQPLLKILPSTTLDELATLADRLLEGTTQVATITTQPSPEVYAAGPAGPSIQRQLDDLRTIVTALVNHLTTPSGRQGRGRSRSRSSQRRGASPQQQNLCYYHRKFGNSARNCAAPCTFNTQGSLNP